MRTSPSLTSPLPARSEQRCMDGGCEAVAQPRRLLLLGARPACGSRPVHLCPASFSSASPRSPRALPSFGHPMPTSRSRRLDFLSAPLSASALICFAVRSVLLLQTLGKHIR